jgi:hypothetical protein
MRFPSFVALAAIVFTLAASSVHAQSVPSQYQPVPNSGGVNLPPPQPAPPPYNPLPGVPLGNGVYGTGSVQSNNGQVNGGTVGVIIPHDIGK